MSFRGTSSGQSGNAYERKDQYWSLVWVQSSVLIQRYGVNADESRGDPGRDDALRLEDVEHGGVHYSRA